MKKFLFATVALALAGVAPAFAGEGNGHPFDITTAQPVYAATIANDTGSQAYPAFAGAPVAATANVATNDTGSAQETRFAGQPAQIGGAPVGYATLGAHPAS